MIPVQISRRCMQNLAARFVGGGGQHVVDPNVDLRYIFDQEENIRKSIEERQLNVDLNSVKEKYSNWFQHYEKWSKSSKEEVSEAKKAMRNAKDGLLEALSLPNFIHSVGKKDKSLLKPTIHAEYLIEKGLMKIDKENELVSLAGYPVLLQNQIKNQLLDLFVDAQLISPSSFARAAILEALNVNVNDYISFHDGSSSKTYLVGHSLPALLSSFVRTMFTEKNAWPIILQSSGMGYHAKRNIINLAYARQRLKHNVLSMGISSEDVDSFTTATISNLSAFLEEELCLHVKARIVRGKELRNYESQAIVFEDNGLEITRISRMDDYVSRRLNICSENGPFLHLVYAETDIDRIIARLFDGLVDGSEVPKILRRVMNS